MSTIPTIRDEHFRGGSNLTKGNRVDSDAILEEIVKAAKVDILAVESDIGTIQSDVNSIESNIDTIEETIIQHTIYVDSMNGSDTTGNGSPLAPFETIQTAVDFAATTYALSVSTNIEAIIKYAGNFEEDVIVDHPNLIFEGSSKIQSLIRSVTVTNATRASVVTYNGSGDYTDLVRNTVNLTPNRFVMRNTGLTGGGAGEPPALRALGVQGDGAAGFTNFMQFGFALENVQVFYNVDNALSFYARNVGFVYFCNVLFNRGAQLFNIGSWSGNDIDAVEGFTVEYAAGDPSGEPTGGYVFTELRNVDCVLGALTLSGTATFDYCQGINIVGLVLNGAAAFKGVNCSIDGDVDCNGTSNLEMLSGHIDGDITIEGTATGHLKGTHVQGGLTLEAGAGAWTVDGGGYMVALAGAGVARVTRNSYI